MTEAEIETELARVRKILGRFPLVQLPVIHYFRALDRAPLEQAACELQEGGFSADMTEKEVIASSGVSHIFFELTAMRHESVSTESLRSVSEKCDGVANRCSVIYDRISVDTWLFENPV